MSRACTSPREARAGAEGQQLRRLSRRGDVAEQHQARRRVLDAQRSHRGEIGQRTGVQNEHRGTVRAQRRGKRAVGDVLRDDRHARVVGEHGAQTEREQVVEVPDGDGDDWEVRA